MKGEKFASQSQMSQGGRRLFSSFGGGGGCLGGGGGLCSVVVASWSSVNSAARVDSPGSGRASLAA